VVPLSFTEQLNWWRHGSQNGQRTHLSKRPTRRLYLEPLEYRCVPSTVTNLTDHDPGSLRDAIASTLPGGTVDFQPGLSGTITLTSAILAITTDLTITGPGRDVITISGNKMFQVFTVAPEIVITIMGLTIVDGSNPSGEGGGISNSGTLTIIGCTLSQNSAGIPAPLDVAGGIGGSGGGIYNSGTLTVIGSALSNNNVASGYNQSGGIYYGHGGGIYNTGTLTLIGSTISGNSLSTSSGTFGSGGGTYNSGTLTITGSDISDNSLTGGLMGNDATGGGIFNSGTLTLTDSTISRNTIARFGKADRGDGGGIYNAGKLTVSGCNLSGNQSFSALQGGGAICNASQGTAAITDCTFDSNLADSGIWAYGGGISNAGTLRLTGSTLNKNSARGYSSGRGGGIENSGVLTIIGSLLSGNSINRVGQGGGIDNSGTLTITASTLSGNSVQAFAPYPPPWHVHGGGIFNFGTLTVIASTLSGNHVQSYGEAGGGGIYNLGGLTILQSTLSGNSALGEAGSTGPTDSWAGDAYGGGVYNGTSGSLWPGRLTVLDSTISANSTAFESAGAAVGGGIYGDAGYPDTLRMRNTLLASNNAMASFDLNGPVTSLGHNLIGIGDGGSGYVDTDLVGTSASPLDPKLGPLQDNGGPTQTMALLPGSPAIDAGAFTDSEWDQRGPGYPRQVNGVTDIGAYEVQLPNNPGAAMAATSFAEATVRLPGTGASAPQALTLTSAAGGPSRLLPQVAATDRFFASLLRELMGFALSQSRQHVPGEADGWAEDLFPDVGSAVR
jgi:hypothetical protein